MRKSTFRLHQVVPNGMKSTTLKCGVPRQTVALKALLTETVLNDRIVNYVQVVRFQDMI